MANKSIEERIAELEKNYDLLKETVAHNEKFEESLEDDINHIWNVLDCDEEDDDECDPAKDIAGYAYDNYEFDSHIIKGGDGFALVINLTKDFDESEFVKDYVSKCLS